MCIRDRYKDITVDKLGPRKRLEQSLDAVSYTHLDVYKRQIRYRNLKGMQGILTGLRPAIVAMIAGAGMSLLLLALFNSELGNLQIADFRIVEAVLFLGSFFLLRKWKVSPVPVSYTHLDVYKRQGETLFLCCILEVF